jgi:hypothetical protein
MIPRIGLPWAFRVLGIVSFGVNLVCALLVRDRNKIIGAKQVPFDWRLFRRFEFCIMEAWAFFSLLGYVVLLFSLPNYAASVGLTSQQGAVIGALLNLGQAIGRPIIGIFSDTAGRINIAAFLTGLCGLFCLVIWIFARSFGVLVFFSLIVGTVAGVIWTTIAPVAAEGLKICIFFSLFDLTDLHSCWSSRPSLCAFNYVGCHYSSIGMYVILVHLIPAKLNQHYSLGSNWSRNSICSSKFTEPIFRNTKQPLPICTDLYRSHVYHSCNCRMVFASLENWST